MGIKLLVLVLLVKIVVARIKVDVKIDENQEVEVYYTGTETRVITDDDINLFNIGDENLKRAVEQTLGKRPAQAYLKSPTPWGDLYKSFNWEQVKSVLSIKSARVKSLERVPVVVMTQDSENSSGHTIKVNTGLSRTVENTLTTSWSNEAEIGVSQEIQYEINVGIAKASGTTGFSCTTTVGKSEEKSKSETIGSTSNVEVELKPGEAITAVLTAIVGYLEIEVVHEAYLIGSVAVNYHPQHNGHYFHQIPVETISTFADIKNKVTTTETIRINFYVEVKLKVYDKKTGLLL